MAVKREICAGGRCEQIGLSLVPSVQSILLDYLAGCSLALPFMRTTESRPAHIVSRSLLEVNIRVLH